MKRKRFEIKYNQPRIGIGRCGGGWKFKLSFMVGTQSILIELWWVTIYFRWSEFNEENKMKFKLPNPDVMALITAFVIVIAFIVFPFI